VEERLDDGGGWTELPLGGVVDPASFPPVPIGEKSRLLPTNGLGPWDFEYFCTDAAERLLDLRDVHLYGDPGQRQHGIDLYGRRPDGRYVAVQAKRYQQFGVKHLLQAVAAFISGRSPLPVAPAQIVEFGVFVSCEVRRKEVHEELARLNQAYAPLLITLWDQGLLSGALIRHRDLTNRWFGPQTVDSVYGARPVPPVGTPLEPDPLLRGPFIALGLEIKRERAQELADAEPAATARLLGELIDELETAGFPAHAALLRRDRMRALRLAGQAEEAFRVSVGELERHVDDGDAAVEFPRLNSLLALRHRLTGGAMPAPFGEADLADDPTAGPDEAAVWGVDHPQLLRLSAVLRYDSAREEPQPDLTGLVEAVSALVLADPRLALPAMRRAVEIAVIHEDLGVLAELGLLADRNPELESGSGTTIAGEDDRLRLRLALAEVTGDFADLCAEADTAGPTRHVGLVHARAARWAAWHDQPDAAEIGWLRAVRAATQEGQRGDVADWLRALRLLRARYRSQQDPFGAEAGRRAQAVRGTQQVLFTGLDTELRALGELHDGDPIRAHRALRQAQLEAVVRGDWRGEFRALELLGEHYDTTAEVAAALACQLRIGNAEKAAAAARRLDHFPVELLDLAGAKTWRLRATLAVVVATAVYADDSQATQLVPWLAQYMDGATADQPLIDQAVQALAVCCTLLSAGEVPAAIDLLRSLTTRTAGEVRFYDGSLLDACGRLLRRTDLAHDRLVALFEECLRWLPHPADRLASSAGETLSRWVGELSTLATGGVHAATDLLARLHSSHATVLTAARQFALALPNPPVHASTHLTALGGDPTIEEIGIYALVLPDDERRIVAYRLVELATDPTDRESARSGSAYALAHIASTLADEDRTNLFDRGWVLTEGLKDGDLDYEQEGPFARFTWSFHTALPAAGLILAAALAVDRERVHRVEDLALTWLGDDERRRAAQQAILRLPAAQLTVDLRLLAAHTDSTVRQPAAILWPRVPPLRPSIGQQLASDTDPQVRRQLARAAVRATGSLEVAGDLLEQLRHDPHLDVRQATRADYV